MEQIFLAYGLPKETVTAIMMLYKNTKAGGDTDFFDIVIGFMQRDTLVPYMFIILVDYERRTSIDLIKENYFTLKRAISRRYHTETIAYADYADDLALRANTFALAEYLLHNLGQAACDIDLFVNSDNTKFKCFNQNGAM